MKWSDKRRDTVSLRKCKNASNNVSQTYRRTHRLIVLNILGHLKNYNKYTQKSGLAAYFLKPKKRWCENAKKVKKKKTSFEEKHKKSGKSVTYDAITSAPDRSNLFSFASL